MSPAPVHLPERWAVADPAPGDPAIEVHAAAPGTYVLRQSKRTSPEAPIMYLLLGERSALLLDTGDGAAPGAAADPAALPLRATVDALVGARELVVAHSHAHHDHVAGDGQFAGRPRTRVVGTSRAAVHAFFGLTGPGAEARFDLGGRELLVLATPGHHPTSITVFDPATGLLLTGDAVYPGRLYVDDVAAFVATAERLAAFARDHEVTVVLGAHVEMTRTPGVDYPVGAPNQPDEAPLALPPSVLDEIRAAARELERSRAARVVRDLFVLVDETDS
jgi:glyoxylase-like metal-dependent hydrolase (beta-lactamase superfamily II)